MICLFNVEINLFNAIILSIEHTFVMEETKWNSKKMAQPAYDKLIKNGEKNLEIVDSDKDKQEVMNMLLGGDENTGSQHAMDALDKIKEVTSPRSYQYRNPKLKQKYSKLLQSKQIKTIEKLIKHVWKLVK